MKKIICRRPGCGAEHDALDFCCRDCWANLPWSLQGEIEQTRNDWMAGHFPLGAWQQVAREALYWWEHPLPLLGRADQRLAG